ncbi:MAG: glycosyltransferase [Phycisphaeraceae bacterium]
MHILCLLRNLPVPNQVYFKSGLFPAAIQAHVKAGHRVAVASLKRDGVDHEALTRQVSRWGARYVPVTRKTWFPPLAYLKDADNLTWLRSIWDYRSLLHTVQQYIDQEGKPDVIAALQSTLRSGVPGRLVSRRHQIPYILWEHGSVYLRGVPTGKCASRFEQTLMHADSVLAVSPQLGEAIRNSFPTRSLNVSVLPNPVDSRFFSPPQDLAPFAEFKGTRFAFAAWSKWRRIKRPDLLLSAFAKVHRQHANTCLLIGGPMTPDMTKQIRRDGVGAAIFCPGTLDQEGIHKLAYAADCCLITSDFETFALSAVESMAAGKPVVSTRCGGPESIVTRDDYGRLVPKDDVDALAEAMIGVMNQATRFEPETIADHCRRNFGEQIFAERWANLYRNVAERIA